MRFPLLTILLLLVISCSNESESDVDNENNLPNNQNPTSEENSPPGELTVSISSVGLTTAQIRWAGAGDPDGDILTYQVNLSTEVFDVGQNTSLNLSDLEIGQSYAGEVIASDGKGGEARSSFEFNTKDINTEWVSTYGGGSTDRAGGMLKPSSGGILIALDSFSSNGDFDLHYGQGDIWLISLDDSGQLIWKSRYGGSGPDIVQSLIEADNGDIIMVGYTGSNDFDFAENTSSSFEAFVIRVSAGGSIVWSKTFGGSDIDRAYSVVKTNDNNFVISGYTQSQDGDIVPRPELDGSNYWVFKVDQNGSLLWSKIYGGQQLDGFSRGTQIAQMNSGSLIVSGLAQSNGSGDVGSYSNPGGNRNLWVIELNSLGELNEEQIISNNQFKGDGYVTMEKTSDEGLLIAYELQLTNDDREIRIVKLDQEGIIEWTKIYGTRFVDRAYDIKEVADGYMIVGYTETEIDEVTANGIPQYLILKLDISGEVLWQKSLGGTSQDFAKAIVTSSQNEFFVLGSTRSDDGDLESNNGDQDVTVFSLKIQ